MAIETQAYRERRQNKAPAMASVTPNDLLQKRHYYAASTKPLRWRLLLDARVVDITALVRRKYKAPAMAVATCWANQQD